VPAGKPIHAIADNYATHKHPKVRTCLARHPRWTFHFTPTSASWLNAAEGSSPLDQATPQAPRVPIHRQTAAAIHRFLAEHNRDPRPFRWTKSPKKILAAVKRGFQGGFALVKQLAARARCKFTARSQIVYRWLTSLAVACSITLLTNASCLANSQTAFGNSTEQVEAGLARLVGCHWSVTGRAAVCPMPLTGGVLRLTNTPAGQPETIEMNALVTTKP
jgi:hypothetical protein